VNRSDSRAGEHRNGELGNQRKVDGDAVAFPDAERLQDVGERRDFTVQIEIRQCPAIARLAFPDQRRLVASRTAEVAVEAVDADVDLTADEPLRVRGLPVEDTVPLPRPLELVRKPRPETLGIFFGVRVELLVANVRLRAKRVGWSERAVFAEEVVDFNARDVGPAADSSNTAGQN
jgi:hypothetical protein